MSVYHYDAVVNGKRRSVIFKAPPGLTLEQAERDWIDNDRATYETFYRDATREDYDAPRERAQLHKRVSDWERMPDA